MFFAPGDTSKTITVQLVDDSGLALTGKVAADFPTTSYAKLAAASVAISLTDLGAITSSYSSGGVKEIGAGYYRLDLPNAALSTATILQVIGEASGKHVLYPPITVGADAIGTGVLDVAAGIETGLTPRQALRLMAAALAGKLSGAAGTTVTIRNAVADSKDRIVATVDSSGNRSALTLDVS